MLCSLSFCVLLQQLGKLCQTCLDSLCFWIFVYYPFSCRERCIKISCFKKGKLLWWTVLSLLWQRPAWTQSCLKGERQSFHSFPHPWASEEEELRKTLTQPLTPTPAGFASEFSCNKEILVCLAALGPFPSWEPRVTGATALHPWRCPEQAGARAGTSINPAQQTAIPTHT